MFEQTETAGAGTPPPFAGFPPPYPGTAVHLPSVEPDTVPVLDGGRTNPEADRKRSRRSGALGWVLTIGVAVVLTVLLRTFILTAYSIPSPSMVPTLEVGDRVVVFQLNRDPARGDVIVFDRPPNDPKSSPDDPDVLIKRVIGLPGETVESRDGQVYIDGKALVEDYLPEGTETHNIDTPIEVPEGHLLVLGDNRGASFDGRYFGPIDKDLVVGRAIARIWPVSRLGGL
ncbi:MAG TPA: signal peptidase I [Microthrixaceae bacterium]|nr:signal peptidase I [Microthrixaceae bacterium]HNI36290.1 signal peptidase I [Microthrixaceae bacterium]